MPERWDIFCRVVDNFGDAGVCWRLARQLSRELGVSVRLWIDDLRSLGKLQPEIVDASRQTIESVEVVRWDAGQPHMHDASPDVVVEAFGCGLPEDYVQALARSKKRAIWIVLEYLSAEPWVREHHGLPSPHPRLPIERYFFFPGFVEGTGGLLREKDLSARRDAFDASQHDAFWRSLGHAPLSREALSVSLFAYDSAPIAELLEHWAKGRTPVVAVVPEGNVAVAVLRQLALEGIAANRVMLHGALEVRIVPFVPQSRYDEVLWACDVNFVRGEDSFVRSQWAARPMIWQIYPQEARAHITKLDAFLELYCAGLSDAAADAVRHLSAAWNAPDEAAVLPAAAWDAFAVHLDELRRHAHVWSERIAASGGLAENLASFCRDKLK